MLLPHFQKMLALYNRYKGLPNFAPTHLSSRLVRSRRKATLPPPPPISWRALHNTLMTAAKETNLSHATMSLCAGESETAGSFSGLLRGGASYVKAEGNSRLVISPVESPVE